MTIHKSKGLEFPVVFIPGRGGPAPGATRAHCISTGSLAWRCPGEEVDRADTPLGSASRRIKEEEGAEGRVSVCGADACADPIYVCGSPTRVGTWWHVGRIYG